MTAAASAVYQIEAQSIVGLAIKARAFSAVERLDKRDCVMHAGTCFGPDLAANVARVLG